MGFIALKKEVIMPHSVLLFKNNPYCRYFIEH